MTTLRVIAKMTMLAQEFRNTFYCAGNDATQANAQDIVDYLRTCYANVSPRLNTSWSLYGATCKELDIESNPNIDYTFTAGTLTGGSGTDPLPLQTAMLGTFVSNTARPNRSRKFFAGFVESDTNAGYFTVAARTDVQALMDDWIDCATGTGLAIAATITRINPVTQTLVGSNLIDFAKTSANPSTQRRRRIGKGI